MYVRVVVLFLSYTYSSTVYFIATLQFVSIYDVRWQWDDKHLTVPNTLKMKRSKTERKKNMSKREEKNYNKHCISFCSHKRDFQAISSLSWALHTYQTCLSFDSFYSLSYVDFGAKSYKLFTRSLSINLFCKHSHESDIRSDKRWWQAVSINGKKNTTENRVS